MTINLKSNSISKIISRSCILIFIACAIHLFSIVNSFEAQQSDADNIDKLFTLKMRILELNYAIRYQPEKSHKIILDIEHLLTTARLFKTSWFNTQSLNRQSATLHRNWQQIRGFLTDRNVKKTEKSVAELPLSIENIILQYQVLADKKRILIYLVDFIGFLFIFLVTVFVFYYANKQIRLPIKKLLANSKALKKGEQKLSFPTCNNEIAVIYQSMLASEADKQQQIKEMQILNNQTMQLLNQAEDTNAFLYKMSQQLNGVKLTTSVLIDALNSLARQINLRKLCLELNDGTFIKSLLGCAAHEPDRLSIPVIIDGKPYGYINYAVTKGEPEHSKLVEIFTGLIAHALFQKKDGLQTQKIFFLEECNSTAYQQHDFIAQSLVLLQKQSTLLEEQVNDLQEAHAKQTLSVMKATLAETNTHLDSLVSAFAPPDYQSDFKEALTIMISDLQTQTPVQIAIKEFTPQFHTDFRQHLHLLQIIREAVLNAINLSHCTYVNIFCMRNNENKSVINIIDNGINKENKKDNDNVSTYIKQRADDIDATFSATPLMPGTKLEITFSHE